MKKDYASWLNIIQYVIVNNEQVGIGNRVTSMYSLMSMRTIIFSSANRASANAFASSVFPTPVGPRNRKLLPRFLDASPALHHYPSFL